MPGSPWQAAITTLLDERRDNLITNFTSVTLLWPRGEDHHTDRRDGGPYFDLLPKVDGLWRR
jgi:hypothetical protein